MARKLTILVDIDDVLLDLQPHWIGALNSTHGTNVKEEEIATWEIADFFPMLSKEEVFAPVMSNDFWATILPTEDGQWFVQQVLNDGHRIKIATASLYETLPSRMERFLKLYHMLSWRDVTVTYDKQDIKGDMLIDDAIHNLIGGEYSKILMNKPYNAAIDITGLDMTRVQSLRVAYGIIRSMAEAA